MPAVGGEQLNGVNIDGREDHADGELPDTGQRNYSIRCWGHWLYYLIIFVVAHFILITFKKKDNFFLILLGLNDDELLFGINYLQ